MSLTLRGLVVAALLCAALEAGAEGSTQKQEESTPLLVRIVPAPIDVRVVEEGPGVRAEEAEHARVAAKREADDLVAQQQAAGAAMRSAEINSEQLRYLRWQFYLSGIATLVAGIGTYFLVRSVQLSRDSTNAAMQTAKYALSEQRPWVKIELDRDRRPYVTRSVNGGWLVIPVILRNVGRTPALKIVQHAKSSIFTPDGRQTFDPEQVIDRAVAMPSARFPHPISSLLPDDRKPTTIVVDLDWKIISHAEPDLARWVFIDLNVAYEYHDMKSDTRSTLSVNWHVIIDPSATEITRLSSMRDALYVQPLSSREDYS